MSKILIDQVIPALKKHSIVSDSGWLQFTPIAPTKLGTNPASYRLLKFGTGGGYNILKGGVLQSSKRHNSQWWLRALFNFCQFYPNRPLRHRFCTGSLPTQYPKFRRYSERAKFESIWELCIPRELHNVLSVGGHYE